MGPRAPRSRLLRSLVLLLASGGATAITRSAAAALPADAAPVLVPPKVIKRIEPVYPPEKLKAGERAKVVLELKIDASGKVTRAKVTTSAGDAFDAAAVEAALALEFAPATKNGVPIPATIDWRFSFDFAEAPAPPVDTTTPAAPDDATVAAPTTGSLAGFVRTPLEEGLAGATLTFTATDGTTRIVTTSPTGAFVVTDLVPGVYKVRVTAEGFAPFEVQETIGAIHGPKVIYRPRLAGDSDEIVVRGDRPPREVVSRTIEQAEITRIPGTNGDAIRSIESMPGVARPPGLAGLIIVRGSAPEDTNFFVDGSLIPIIFHFGGLSSVIPSELVEKLDFYPGNFSPEFGRVMGGIIDVGVRSPNKKKLTGLLQFDLIDGRILAEGPIDDKTRFAVAGRRSWVDVWLGPVLRAAGTGVSTAPVYYDYQLMVERDLTSKTTARVLFFGSDDRLAITLNAPSDSDPGIGGDITSHQGFFRIQARTQTEIGSDSKWTNTLATGEDFIDFGLGNLAFNLKTLPIDLRSDLRAKISKEASVIVGLDAATAYYDVSVRAPSIPANGQDTGPFFASPVHTLTGSGFVARPGVYGMLDLSPIKELKILPGIRVDYSQDTAKWDVSPRLAVRLDVHHEFPRTTLKGGYGLFFQPPQPYQSLPPFGAAGLNDNRATHYDLGFEQEFSRQVELSIDGFYKDLRSLVEQSPSLTSSNGVVYNNVGSGLVYGAEVLLRWKPDAHFFGWLSYTLSRSERRDAPDQPEHLFQYDQPHILTVLGSYKLGRGWEIGARFRYVSGSMYTPNLGGVVDYDAGAYAPIQSYPLYTARLPSFNQLDIRVDKEWKFTSWSLHGYLDIENVYNRANPEAQSYNYNYSQTSTVSGLPFLPILGLRGEL